VLLAVFSGLMTTVSLLVKTNRSVLGNYPNNHIQNRMLKILLTAKFRPELAFHSHESNEQSEPGSYLREAGHNLRTVKKLGLRDAKGSEICDYALAN
jgi:hypothetical protein